MALSESPNVVRSRRTATRRAIGSPIRLRENFDALAVFAASVTTDADGVAKVKVKLPDNLTRYRIVAVAVEGERRAGTGESNLTARLPLMARPSAPRFLNFGDKFELPITIQNQTDSSDDRRCGRPRDQCDAHTTARAAGSPFPPTDASRYASRPRPPSLARPGSRSPPRAGARRTPPRSVSPVWTPATTEAFATYGVLDNGAAAQAIQAPGDVQPGFGGLEVTTSSTALQELTDAYIYLLEYPYGCAEQISSRVLTTAALKDVLTAFKPKGHARRRRAQRRDGSRPQATGGASERRR